MAEVRLVDLEVIKRYSLAVRREAVPAEELLAALEASRATVEAAMAPASRSAKGRRTRSTTTRTTKSASARKAKPKAAPAAPPVSDEPEKDIDPVDVTEDRPVTEADLATEGAFADLAHDDVDEDGEDVYEDGVAYEGVAYEDGYGDGDGDSDEYEDDTRVAS